MVYFFTPMLIKQRQTKIQDITILGDLYGESQM